MLSEKNTTSINKLQKIVILGPESTGKSTLCQQLAKHYGATDCKEYARQYLQENGTKYTFENLLTIAQGQLTLEDEAIKKSNLFLEKGKNKLNNYC